MQGLPASRPSFRARAAAVAQRHLRESEIQRAYPAGERVEQRPHAEALGAERTSDGVSASHARMATTRPLAEWNELRASRARPARRGFVVLIAARVSLR